MIKPVKITAIKQCIHHDLIQHYELDMEVPCTINEGDVFISVDMEKPIGLCESAWIVLYPYVMTIASGGSFIHGAWMKDPSTAMVACNDGFRPMSFLVEPVKEDDDGKTI